MMVVVLRVGSIFAEYIYTIFILYSLSRTSIESPTWRCVFFTLLSKQNPDRYSLVGSRTPCPFRVYAPPLSQVDRISLSVFLVVLSPV